MSYDPHEDAALPSQIDGPRRRRVRAPHVPAQRRAFHRLYRQYFGLVWSMVRRFGVPVAQHEDAVQEVWLVAYRRLHTLEADASAKAWLSTITRRVAFRLRRTEHRRRRKIEAIEMIVESPAPGSVDIQDARRLLDALFERLDDDQRVALLLAQVHGLTGPEIAQTLEISVNTAYSRVRLARKKVARFADEVGAEQATVLQALRRREQPPRRAAAQAWLVLAPELGRLATGTAAVGKASGLASLLGVTSSAKVFAVTLAVGLVGLTGVRVAVDRASGETDTVGKPRSTVAAASTHDRGRHRPAPTDASAMSLAMAPAAAVAIGEPSGSADSRGLSVSSSALGSSEGVAAPSRSSRSIADRTRTPVSARPGPSSLPPDAGNDDGPVISAEAQLLGRAQRSLAEGRPSEALRLLEEHERRFPKGALVDARRGARVRALCDLGREAQARAEARQLVVSHPDSPVAAGIVDACT